MESTVDDAFLAYLQSDNDSFASSANLTDRLTYINQTLEIHGLPGPLRLQNASNEDAATTLNCLYALLQQRLDDVKDREERLALIRRQQSDLDRFQVRVSDLQQQLSDSKRECRQLQVKLESAEGAVRREIQVRQAEREESLKAAAQMHHRNTHSQHEIRKKELAFTKLQEKLASLLSDRERAAKVGIEVINDVQRQALRSQWQRPARGEEEILKRTLDMFERKHDLLADENAILQQQVLELTERLTSSHALAGDAATERLERERLSRENAVLRAKLQLIDRSS